ncbi:hypothetical protein NMG29_31520 [Streptomyces cocklensis]|jgi:hypothetical protein|uniref:Uncharacterized protein n=1 Tax=Actinacidiphila cocklensis TaxID=887465 RepID=A0A9W4E2K8_9ACTN|nr:hypothetical protein [Actinacidiphila cocklensis]MDD1062674.1 hypothetical protein [Actinacidiphila cocklensis]WSX75450.1 hypothetical protein OH826_17020 [Streptomyces sp. NBC_00899]CAG6392105.1 conserved membrane hypothetical protein [Actinacidiphila cocklensis]
MNVLLEVVGSLVAVVGIAVSLLRRPLPWLEGQTARPVVWGLGYALLGLCLVLMGAFSGHSAGLHVILPGLLLLIALPLIVTGTRGAPLSKRN